MPVVSQKISNLIGGVSQQPDSLKLPGQLRECDNYLPDPSFGLLKRPGSVGIGSLANATQDGSYFSMFLDQENRFVVQFAKNGTVRIWDADSGVQQPVNTQSSTALTYATHTDKSQLELLQINDFVFVVNRAVRVLEDATKSPVITPTAFVLINTVSYDSTYTVIVDSTTFTYNSPSGSGGSGPLALSAVREAIRALIDANPTYVATAVGNAIRVRRADNGPLSINASGGDSGAAIEAYAGVVPSPAQLPREYFNGDKVQVNVPGSGTTGYWLQFNVTNAAASGAGVWVETIAPDTALRATPTTMPHVLIQEANGTFTFREFSSTLAGTTVQSASVAGTVATVTVTDPGLASYAVGQTFSVAGGTGINLRLRVTGTRTDTTTTTSTLPGTTKVRWLVYSDRVEYNWIVNGTTIAVTPNDSPITLGDSVYSVGGAYVADPGPLPSGVIQAFDAPITTVTTRTGVVDTVEPSRIGRGYTASDVVADLNGATFTVATIQTVTQEVIPFAKQSWTDRTVGDLTSNPNPSFIGTTVTGMSFFQNRLVVLSGEDVVCSKAGDFFNFFNDSAAQFVESDPVDISCGSRTPVQLRFAISTNQGLYLFSDNAQYVLGTNTDAFSAASAEINQISNYPQSFRVGPVDTGSTFIFAEENDRSTMLFEIAPGDGRQGRVEAADLTRLVPTYIPAGLIDLQISQSLSVVAARSTRTPNTIYMFRFFNRGNERVMASWFKWTMPTEVKAIFFYQETLFVLMRCPSGCGTIITKMSLLSDGPSGAIRFLDKVYDVRLDVYDYLPVVTYDAGNDESTIRFKSGFYLSGAQPVVISLDPFNPGNVEEPDVDQDINGFFVVVPGDRTSDRLALGLKYNATALMPSFYLRQGDDGRADTVNIPTLNRIQIDSFESGPFRVLVDSVGRQPFELEIPQRVANSTPANTIPMLRTGKNVFPVMSRGDLTEVSFIADSPFPTAMNALVWEGTYNTKGVRVL
jgi:hypothetical protein